MVMACFVSRFGLCVGDRAHRLHRALDLHARAGRTAKSIAALDCDLAICRKKFSGQYLLPIFSTQVQLFESKVTASGSQFTVTLPDRNTVQSRASLFDHHSSAESNFTPFSEFL
jgi:hypothetical protein